MFDIIGKQVKNLYGLAAVFGELDSARRYALSYITGQSLITNLLLILLGRYEAMC